MSGEQQHYMNGVGRVSLSQLKYATHFKLMVGRNVFKAVKEPFSLGIEGEFWAPQIPALCVPVKRHDTSVYIVVRLDGDKFRVYDQENPTTVENILMAAAVVQDKINRYHER